MKALSKFSLLVFCLALSTGSDSFANAPTIKPAAHICTTKGPATISPTNITADGITTAILLMKRQQYGAAKAKLESLSKYDPNPNTYNRHMCLAIVYEHTGDSTKQIKEYEAILSLKTDDQSFGISNNLAVAYMNFGRDADAEREFRHSIALNPKSPNGYANLALLYRKQGKTKEALDNLEHAYKLGLRDAEMLVGMGGLYSTLGEFDKSISCLTEYVVKYPKAPQATEVSEHLRKLKEVKTLITVSANSEDYLADVVKQSHNTWSQSKRKLLVFIKPVNNLQGYDGSMKSSLQDSFIEWQDALEQHLTFEFVSEEKGADIVCQFIDKPKDKTSIEAGHTSVKTSGTEGSKMETITHADITIALRTNFCNTFHSAKEIRQIALHEIGHALGLHGHSANNRDLMFPQACPTVADHLTDRDKATIRRLYSRDVETAPQPTTITLGQPTSQYSERMQLD